MRVAMLRFLLLGHPEASSLGAKELDELSVKLLYSFARAIERNTLVKKAEWQLAEHALPTFAHAAPLLHV